MKLAVSVAAAVSAFGVAAGAIDVHAHHIPEGFRALLRRHGAERAEGFPLPPWDTAGHVAAMDRAGVSCALLTLAAPQPWFGDAAEAKAACRAANEAAAEAKARHPGRFRFCAALPLPDVQAAIEEARRALDVLGADGVGLATNVGGRYLGDPALDPLMDFLAERKALVVLHPHRPNPVNAATAALTPPPLFEYQAETTRALVNLFARNVLAKRPGLRVVVPHAGAFLPLAVPRMRGLNAALAAQGQATPIDWEGNLAALWVDLAGVTEAAPLRALIGLIPPSRWLYGSDYPYQGAEAAAANLARLRALLEADPATRLWVGDILEGNAQRLLGGGEAPAHPAPAAPAPLARLSLIEVDPAHLEDYKAFLKEGTETSVRVEPGVLTLYAVQEKERPTHFTILEIYADEAAYRAHLQTPHFRKYKEGTLPWVRSLRLVDTAPLNPAMPIKPPPQGTTP